jgi:hypothetical protein
MRNSVAQLLLIGVSATVLRATEESRVRPFHFIKRPACFDLLQEKCEFQTIAHRPRRESPAAEWAEAVQINRQDQDD